MHERSPHTHFNEAKVNAAVSLAAYESKKHTHTYSEMVYREWTQTHTQA